MMWTVMMVGERGRKSRGVNMAKRSKIFDFVG